MLHVSALLCGIKKKNTPYLCLRSHFKKLRIFLGLTLIIPTLVTLKAARTEIYDPSNRSCSGLGKSNTGVLMANKEIYVKGPRETLKTLKMVENETLSMRKL